MGRYGIWGSQGGMGREQWSRGVSGAPAADPHAQMEAESSTLLHAAKQVVVAAVVAGSQLLHDTWELIS